MILTASNAELGNAIFGMIVLGFAIRIAVLIGTVSLITWVVKKIWYAGRDRKYRSQNRKWRKFQKREEKRERQRIAEYEHYKKHEAPKVHKEWQKQQKVKKPDPSQGFENNPDWYWDEESNLWRYKGKK